MKLINTIIGIVVVLLGCLLVSITIDNNETKTIMYKVFGMVIGPAGILYLSKFGLGKNGSYLF